MIDFDGKEMQEEFNRVFPELGDFEKSPIQNLKLEQLWWLTKFAKHVRGRCRNNSAFNSYMNRNFSPARFSEVPKEYQGKIYKGLKITVNNESSEGDE